MNDIVDLTTFHTDMRDLQLFMKVKDRYLTQDFPAWTAIGELLRAFLACGWRCLL